MDVNPKIEQSWKLALLNEFEKEYFQRLKSFLVEEKSKHIIFPPGSKIFEAFNKTPLPDVKVVILGQDPYHNDGQAHGLCFSVNHGIPIPPSLSNIFKELTNDTGFIPPSHGNLEAWAAQGVFLLNATLTVRAHQAGSHQKKGWEIFTDEVIRQISSRNRNVVFMLWGNYARSKKMLINNNEHLILEAVHPSPLSAYSGFFGCNHFSKANAYLESKGLVPINWQL